MSKIRKLFKQKSREDNKNLRNTQSWLKNADSRSIPYFDPCEYPHETTLWYLIPIDTTILPIIRWLNEQHFTTNNSCEGDITEYNLFDKKFPNLSNPFAANIGFDNHDNALMFLEYMTQLSNDTDDVWMVTKGNPSEVTSFNSWVMFNPILIPKIDLGLTIKNAF